MRNKKSNVTKILYLEGEKSENKIKKSQFKRKIMISFTLLLSAEGLLVNRTCHIRINYVPFNFPKFLNLNLFRTMENNLNQFTRVVKDEEKITIVKQMPKVIGKFLFSS